MSVVRSEIIAIGVLVALGVIAQAFAYGMQGPESLIIALAISGFPVIAALGIYILGLPFHRSSPSTWLTKDTAGTIKVATAAVFALIAVGVVGILVSA